MSLTSPAALFWFLLAIPIVIFYLLKIRLRRVPVSTTMFWNQIYEEKKPRSIWQQLRHLLSLLLQLLFLALLALALTDPLFFWETNQKRRLVILLDRSASMQANDTSEGSRLEAAKVDIHDMIRTLRSRDDMALIAVGATAEVVTGLTGHHRTLHQAVDGLEPTDQPTDFREALKLANSLIEGHPNGEIVLMTDGGFDDFENVAATEHVVSQLYGEPDTANVGITQFQIRRNLIDPVGYEVLVEVINQSSEPAETRLEMELEGDIVDVIPLKLEPDETWSKVLEYTSPTGGILTALLDKEDALASDNEAYAILSTLQPQKVILVSEGNRFLEQVFNAIPLVELEIVAKQPETIPENGVLVFHRKTPEVLPTGNVLVIEPESTTDLWTVGETESSPLIAAQDKESKLMAHVRLDNVLLSEARKIEPKTEIEELATSVEEIPIYFSHETDQQKVIVLNASLDEGDLPLRTAFPILMSNALNWFSGAESEFLESLATGAVRKVDVSELEPDSTTIDLPKKPDSAEEPSGSERVTRKLTSISLTGPQEHAEELIAQDEQLWLGPLNHVGLWKLSPVTQEKKTETTSIENTASVPIPQIEIACNLANSQESNLRTPELTDSVQKLQQAGFSFSPFWFYLILFATIFSCVEWYLYQRRWVD
ncbi:MAG: BatA and WFA domain-containing protein [Planctomycetaceae bacterium]|nr:BatA and WFA domain-containing protein [Planctomycetaceae bacterium]